MPETPTPPGQAALHDYEGWFTAGAQQQASLCSTWAPAIPHSTADLAFNIQNFDIRDYTHDNRLHCISRKIL
jgi:hypothetical protein